MLALENKQRKTHELWLFTTTLLKIFEAKRLIFPEPHQSVTAKKICVWQRSNKDTFPLETFFNQVNLFNQISRLSVNLFNNWSVNLFNHFTRLVGVPDFLRCTLRSVANHVIA